MIKINKPKKPQMREKNISIPEVKPWDIVFKNYGFTQSPDYRIQKTNDYGVILSWVTGDNFELERDIDLAISIWLGHIDIWDDEWLKELQQKSYEVKLKHVAQDSHSSKKSLFSP